MQLDAARALSFLRAATHLEPIKGYHFSSLEVFDRLESRVSSLDDMMMGCLVLLKLADVGTPKFACRGCVGSRCDPFASARSLLS